MGQLKAYVMLQLSYLTRATKVWHFIIELPSYASVMTHAICIRRTFRLIIVLFIGFLALSQNRTRSACRFQLSICNVYAAEWKFNVEFESNRLVLWQFQLERILHTADEFYSGIYWQRNQHEPGWIVCFVLHRFQNNQKLWMQRGYHVCGKLFRSQ